MNRKERRVAAKSQRHAPSAELGHARALHLRGEIARRQGRLAEAIAHFTEAAAAAPDIAAIHDGLAEAYRAVARPVDAERHYRRVAELQPSAATLLNLGNALIELQRPAEAAAAYQAASRFDGRLAEAHHGLGAAWLALGRTEAAAAFTRAVVLRPDFALAHEGLIDACLAADAAEAGLRSACAALLHVDTTRLRVQFVDCVLALSPPLEIPGLRVLLQRALRERWTRPRDLAAAICAIVALQRFDARDPLLCTLLELVPIPHRDIEQQLTEQRREILHAAASGAALDTEVIIDACRLARQCFINEYAWRRSDAEGDALALLGRAIETDLAGGAAPADAKLAVFAMYLSLGSLDGAARLLTGGRLSEVVALLAQQVGEPAEERRLRDSIARATSIEDDVSRRVRDQYEENPYPRWVATIKPAYRVQLADWLTDRFPGVATPPPAEGTLEVLVAGCGTGQHAIETVQALAGAKVLAIDLSLASLAYARRMTAALGVSGIDYVQADLLQAARLARRFDMIAVGGVLHHLGDPWSGWRALHALLRPGGVMNVLLYTERGRTDVKAARDWIAANGYGPTADAIRECRQALLASPEDWAARLSASPDFSSLSGCRDLLFHVQERPVTLPEVARFLDAEGIELLGIEVSAATEQAFRQWRVSEDPLRDLAGWDLFEAEHPGCFAGMLNLWVRRSIARPAAAPPAAAETSAASPGGEGGG